MFSQPNNSMSPDGNDVVDDRNEEGLFQGQVFASHDAMLTYVDSWLKRTFCPLTKVCDSSHTITSPFLFIKTRLKIGLYDLLSATV